MSETIQYKGKTIKIQQDEDAESPSGWGDNSLFIVANHRDFYVPAPGEKRCSNDPEDYVNAYSKTHWMFQLEAYIHSGVVLALSNTGNFPDRQWDVSQVGWVFCAKKEWRLSKKAREAALSLVKTWNEYLSGDVWGYVIDGDNEDSCWGFYGYDYCVQEAKGVVDCIVERERKALEKAKAFIRNSVPLESRVFA